MKTPESPFENPSALSSDHSTTSKASKTTKLATILRLLVSGQSLNRFEAERHHDHCLNTTISTLQNGHAVQIERRWETVPCKHGQERTRVCRYWLSNKPENILRARVLLAHMVRKA